ncbi:hypothetical protein B1H19_36430 [Streptomyces gilvosporeus]|uniref:Uncharacterized protein n=1 Tax=Streptomyces gilvosporeus TaxID=553510 RepID=A0A1V0U1Y3_9ACTN|nr:hypothetical protein B1H19_36430 [Streptomyces gilvosporeus]
MWDRNAVLAEAFCLGDERVREAQARLDEAQADRSRVLAAFAVTVGSTGAVAGLFGLNEREVRIARRTVGKDDARAVAEQLLAAAPNGGAPNAAPREPETATSAPDTPSDQTADAAPSSFASSGTRPTATPRESRDTAASSSEPSWSAALDAVLVGSWQTGVDLRELATEFGLDFNRLLTRAQQLAAQGRFHHGPGHAGETYGGRHRRGDLHESECTIPAQQTPAWNATAPSGHMASAWHPGAAQPAETVADMSTLAPEWDSALAPWGTITQPYTQPYQEPEPAHQPWTQYHLSS